MNDAIAQLGGLANEWAKNDHVPEVDWARVRSFGFQELLNRRNTLVKRLEGSTCVLCKEFDQHVCPSALSNASESHVYI
jgi:antiviral helicase SKI2